jgi:hypothetical protein
MDSFEKKVHELYQQKKQEDEKSIPRFDTFRFEPVQANSLKQPYFLVKLSASVVLVMAAGTYYFFSSRKATTVIVKAYPVKIGQQLPTRSLLDKNAGTGYIWNWKAPTDQLLHDATKSVKTQIKI